MARTDDDTWDLASSVGVTATAVAASRAIASRAAHPLISDPFAEPLVRAVGMDVFTKLATGELAPTDIGGSAGLDLDRMTDNLAVRTRFFDEFFLDAVSTGIRQVVILASGLDSRGYRLDWPAGTTLYEIDQPSVIEFKSRVLAGLGAHPSADRRAVAIDLRDDWATALNRAGFDPTVPTAWSAEGLLGYLPPEAQDRLLDTVTVLSAPGSRLATESTPALAPDDREAREAKLLTHLRSTAVQWRDHGLDLDFAELIYFGDRNDASTYLTGRGWQIRTSTVNELLAANGLPPMDEDTGFGDLAYVSATRA